MDDMEEIRIADDEGIASDLPINRDIDGVIVTQPDEPKKDRELVQGADGTLRIDGGDTPHLNGQEEE